MPTASQSFPRQIEASQRSVLVEVAQNVGKLERAAEVMSERETGFLLHAEHAHRKTTDRAGDAVAIEIERGPVRCADVGDHIHLHAIDDGDEILALQVECADRLRQAAELRRRCAAIDRINVRAPALPVARGAARAGPDRRQCRRRRGRTNRFRTLPRAGRAAKCACRYKTSCGRPARPQDWAHSLTHPAASASQRKDAGQAVETLQRGCRRT